MSASPDGLPSVDPVVLRHAASGWAALVDPARGAALTSFTAPDGWELFAQGHPPAAAPVPGDPFADSGLTGHVDCLPTIAEVRSGIPGRPDLPLEPLVDHGPLWCRAWSVTGSGADASSAWLRLAVEVPGWDLTVVRTVTVGPGRLILDYELTNPADLPVPVLWAGHGLLAAPRGTRVQADGWRPLPGAPTTRTLGLARDTADTLLAEVGRTDGLGIDDTPPRSWVKAYASWPRDGAWLLRPDGKVHVEAAAPAAGLWLGLWVNHAGMPPTDPLRHVALEPTTGDDDALSSCVDRRSCWWVPGRTTVSWSMRYTVHRT